MTLERIGENLVLLDRIATGGMGEVFRAKQIGAEGFEKIVAVKRILPQFAARKELAEMFRREMRVAAQLQHANIVQVFGNGVVGEYLYLVMEFVKGCTVADLIAETHLRGLPTPIDVVCFIISETAKGLHYAHTVRSDTTGAPLELIHRDITPQNVMCSFNGEVKVMDFGIAKVTDHLSTKTRTGEIKGKLQYMAPEQLDSGAVDARVDIFSLGCVFFELLTKQPLFLEENPARTIQNVMTKPIPSLKDLRPDASPALERILNRALERDPERRFRTAEEMRRDLTTFMHSAYPGVSATDLSTFIRELGLVNERAPMDATIVAKRDKSRLTSLARRALPYTLTAILSCALVLAIFWGVERAVLSRIESAAEYQPVRNLEPTPVEPGMLIDTPLRMSVFSNALAHFAMNADAAADGQRVAEWRSSGSSAISFIQREPRARPVVVQGGLSGLGALQFNGSSSYLISDQLAAALGSSNGFTALLIARLASTGKPSYLLSLQQANYDLDVFRFGIDKEGFLRVKVIETAHIQEFIRSDVKAPAEWGLYTVVVAPDRVTAYLNGEQLLDTELAAPLRLERSAVVSMGQEFDSRVASDFLKGEIAEALFFDRVLDTSARLAVEEQLQLRVSSTARPTVAQ